MRSTHSCHPLLELEWMLSEKGAVKSSLEEDPRKKRKVRDVMSEAIRQNYRDAEDSDDDTISTSFLGEISSS